MTPPPNPDEPGAAPAEPKIRAQIERMISSDPLRTSPQLVSFLQFVVNETLGGRSHRIKGYTIGVEALHRDPDFNPQADPIVRVEAGRLRRALKRYYAEAGSDDDILITIPPGGYIPVFSERNVAVEEAVAPPDDPPRRPARLRLRASIAVAAAIAVLVLVSFMLWRHFASPAGRGFVGNNGASGVSVQVLRPGPVRGHGPTKTT